jgi:hypothetical protein
MEGRVLHVEGYEGKVVAIDMDSDQVVVSAESPEALMVIVRAQRIQNAMIVRVPAKNSPLRVGLG